MTALSYCFTFLPQGIVWSLWHFRLPAKAVFQHLLDDNLVFVPGLSSLTRSVVSRLTLSTIRKRHLNATGKREKKSDFGVRFLSCFLVLSKPFQSKLKFSITPKYQFITTFSWKSHRWWAKEALGFFSRLATARETQDNPWKS